MTATARRNGHHNAKADRLAGIADDAVLRAARAVIAACAYRLAVIDDHRISPELFSDPSLRLLCIALQTFRRQFPDASQAPASALVRFIAGLPELSSVLRAEGSASQPGTISPSEIVSLLDAGWHDVHAIEGNAQVLRDHVFDEQKRLMLVELDRFGGSRDEFSAEARARIETLERFTTGPSRRSQFTTLTSQDLATNAYTLEYLIPGLLVKGQPAVLGGPKKSLKTSTLVDLALSLASQSKFLGEFCVSRAVRVGVMSGESGAATIQETAVRVAKSKPWVNLQDYTNVAWSFELPKLGQPDTGRILKSFITEQSLEVLIVDPLYLALLAGDAASNLYSMGAKLGDLTEVIRDTGCTIVLAHHARKMGRGDINRFSPPELDDLSFAGISEFARQWLLIGRRAEYDPENGGHHELWLAAGGSAGHSGLWAVDVDEGTRQSPGGRRWDVTVAKASVARQEEVRHREADKAAKAQERRLRDEQRLLEAYQQFPNGETASVLRSAAGMNAAKFGEVNSVLIQKRLVAACRVSKSRSEHDGFRLQKGRSDNSDNSDNRNTCPTSPTTRKGRSDKPPSLEGGSPSVRPFRVGHAESV